MVQRLEDSGEFGLIKKIRKLMEREGIRANGVTLGIGDDCASFLPDPGYETLITCDCMVEGRHYLPGRITPFDLGRRAMVMNISDIAAMGGIPLYALVSLGLKKNTAVEYIEDMYRGFLKELNPLNAAVIGGNITGSEHSEFINITLIGKVESERALCRSGAKAGDSILVTGYPGQAAAGLKILLENPDDNDGLKNTLVAAYNRPSHRAKEGRAVALSGLATSMIDISDGLLGDLSHICEDSNMGAKIFRNRLPISQPMCNLINPQGWDIFETIIGDSDDYELIITCTPENTAKIKGAIAEVSNVPVTEIGTITGRAGIRLITSDGVSHPVRTTGWDHFKGKD
jgi:thiamine-monophosphate kinase